MLSIDTSLHRIVSFAQSQGWNAERYGKEAGVPPSTARDVLRRRGNPTAATLRAMESVIPKGWRSPSPPTAPRPPAAP